MEEGQVSLDGNTHQLPTPFFVIATQNPVNQAGTYPLPESQLDRFLMRITLGYPSWEAEKHILQSNDMHTSAPVVASPSILVEWQQQIQSVHASDAVIDYILRLVRYSRESGLFTNPLSPRASKALLITARSWAWINGRDYVIPDDVQSVFSSVAEHRLRASNSDSDLSYQMSEKLLSAVDSIAA